MNAKLGNGETSCHLIDFFHDEQDACALTIFRHNIRFHIIADPERLRARSTQDDKILSEYKHHLDKLKIQVGEIDVHTSEKAGASQTHTEKAQRQIEETDSGIDVTCQSPNASSSPGSDDCASTTLQTWMLSPFASIFKTQAPAEGQQSCITLDEWYCCKTLFYTLETQDGSLTAVEEEKTQALEKRMKDLIPRLRLPKYVLDLKIPLFKAADLEVTQTSDSPAPFHPSGVRIGEQTYFVKLVDANNPPSTKREIQLMKRLERLELHKQFNVPLVKGIIGFENRRNQIMGFLQTEIPEPRPLTEMLDSNVPQDKRDTWANEARRIKEVLHENKIIWGDAKADNFMVDKYDRLWIIDFGGSYTEGWVDPELNETKEGDDMGVERIANGLRDPDANTYGGEERTQPNASAATGGKRKVTESGDADGDEDRKRFKNSS